MVRLEGVTAYAHNNADAAIKARADFRQRLVYEEQAGYPVFAINVAKGGLLRLRELIALRIEQLVTPESELPQLYALRDQDSTERFPQ